jgi:hypothetical protein
MWPDLFGSGWVWGVLLSFGVLGALIGALVWLEILTRQPAEVDDTVQRVWHRYEQGDLTRAEFDRLRWTLPEFQMARAGSFPHSYPRGRGAERSAERPISYRLRSGSGRTCP